MTLNNTTPQIGRQGKQRPEQAILFGRELGGLDDWILDQAQRELRFRFLFSPFLLFLSILGSLVILPFLTSLGG
jgi:hypothetical protein